MNLFLLPFAGGTKYAYRKFVNYAPLGLKVVPIEIPGRGSRIREVLITRAGSVVDDILLQIRERLDQPYAIYGHSMGALLTFLLARRISEAGLSMPAHLFLSGCEAPSVPIEQDRYKLPRESLKEKLRELGGCPEDILQSDELFSFFEPIIRADFEIVETYRYNRGAPLNIPITVMIGTEERATVENVKKWKEETNGEVQVFQFPGNHFFIFNYEKDLIELISRQLNCEITN